MQRTALLIPLAAACGGSGVDRVVVTPPEPLVTCTLEAADAPLETGVCRDGWCWVSPSPHGFAVNAVFGFAEDDVWAAGDGGIISRFDGASWRTVRTGTATYHALWGTSSNDLWVAGTELLHFDGSDWTRTALPRGETLHALHGFGPREIWAVGGRAQAPDASGPRADLGVVRRFDGASWSGVPTLAGGPLRAIAGASPDDLWVITRQQGSPMRWDGARWHYGVLLPAQAEESSVWAVAPDDVWIATRFAMLHWDGAAWRTVNDGLADPEHQGPRHLFARGGELFLLAGGGQVYRWDGARWALIPGTDRGRITAQTQIWVGPTSIWSSGDRGLPRRFDGAEWKWREPWFAEDSGPVNVWSSGALTVAAGPVPEPNGGSALFHVENGRVKRAQCDAIIAVSGLSGTGPNDVWAASSKSCLHFDGTRWMTVPELKCGSSPATAIAGTGPTDVWVGTSHFDGHTMTRTTDLHRGAGTVWARTRDDAWAVGLDRDNRMFLSRWDGTSWRDVTALIASATDRYRDDFRALEGLVWGSGERDVWVSLGPAVLRWDGATFEEVLRTEPSWVTALSGSGPDDVHAGLEDGTLLHWDGHTWSEERGFVTPERAFGGVTSISTTTTAAWATHRSNVLVRTR